MTMLRMRPSILLPVLLVLAGGLLSGCYERVVGPEGPPGPPGDPAVESFIVDFFVDDAAVNGTVVSQTYDAPEITPGVVQEGMVMAYFREQGTWTALPYTYGEESPTVDAVDYTVTLGYAFETGFVEVFYEVSNEVAFQDLVDREIKVVILYGDPARFSVDWSDYNEVARTFDLE